VDEERRKTSLVHRLLSGTLIFREEDRILELISPSLDVKLLSDVVYEEHYQDNIYDFILKEDVRPLLLKAELIGHFYDKDLERIIKKIEKIKIQLFLNYWDRTKTKRNRAALKHAKKSQIDLMTKGMSFDHLTLEHFCNMEAVKYQISRTLRDHETKQPVLTPDSNKIDYEKYLHIINQHTLELNTIRKVARSEYWKGYFLSNEHNVFGKNVGDLNPEQLSLLTTTRMYTRIAEHTDAPNETILNDDDALDGWVLHQTEKALEEKKKGDKKDSKIGNAQEVFYMAENQEQREDILALNTQASEQIQKNRMNQVMNTTEAIDSADFQDVRQELNEAVANKQKRV